MRYKGLFKDIVQNIRPFEVHEAIDRLDVLTVCVLSLQFLKPVRITFQKKS